MAAAAAGTAEEGIKLTKIIRLEAVFERLSLLLVHENKWMNFVIFRNGLLLSNSMMYFIWSVFAVVVVSFA